MEEYAAKNKIPVDLTREQFDQFFCQHLTFSALGRKPKISSYKYLSYILKVLYTGMQWASLVIEKDDRGQPEIHYTSVHRRFQIWRANGSLAAAFEKSVSLLQQNELLDTSILHGDGTSTAAKKGGDNLGYSGHKHFKGEKIVAFTDRNANIISPFVTAPGNRNETVLLKNSLNQLSRVASDAGINLTGAIISLDAGYDSVSNRKLVFNRHMVPNIKEVNRKRKGGKRGRKRFYQDEIFKERFQTVERAFAWEDKFKRLLLRFEHISANHLGMKHLAYTLINLRHFC